MISKMVWAIYSEVEAKRIAYEYLECYYGNPVNSRLKPAQFNDEEQQSFSRDLFARVKDTHTTSISFKFDDPVHSKVFRLWDEDYRKENSIVGYHELEDKKESVKGTYSALGATLSSITTCVATAYFFVSGLRHTVHGVYYQIGSGVDMGKWVNSYDEEIGRLWLSGAFIGVLGGVIAGAAGYHLAKELWRLSPSIRRMQKRIKAREQLEERLMNKS